MIIVILIGVILLLGIAAYFTYNTLEFLPIFCMLLAIFLLIVAIGLERLTADNTHKIATFNSKVLAAQQFHSPLWRHIFCSDAYYNFELLPLPMED